MSDKGPKVTGSEPQRQFPSPWVWLARIRRPQGRKGEVFAELLTDFPEKFSERRRLWLLPEAASAGADDSPLQVQLINHWPHKGGIVLHFSGVDSISAAEELAGRIVAVPRSERAVLAEGEAYIGDLVGCTLIDLAGAVPLAVGEIEDVDRSAGPVALLVVRRGNGEVLIPLAKSYLRRIDIESRRVEMVLPEGLIELNEGVDRGS